MSVKSSTANNKKSLGSLNLEILTWPNTAEVTLAIDSKNGSTDVPLSSVESMYIFVAVFCVALFNCKIPVPGSAGGDGTVVLNV